MPRTWQYKTIAMTHGRIALAREDQPTDLDEELGAAGQEGWELVHLKPAFAGVSPSRGDRTRTCNPRFWRSRPGGRTKALAAW